MSDFDDADIRAKIELSVIRAHPNVFTSAVSGLNIAGIEDINYYWQTLEQEELKYVGKHGALPKINRWHRAHAAAEERDDAATRPEMAKAATAGGSVGLSKPCCTCDSALHLTRECNSSLSIRCGKCGWVQHKPVPTCLNGCCGSRSEGKPKRKKAEPSKKGSPSMAKQMTSLVKRLEKVESKGGRRQRL